MEPGAKDPMRLRSDLRESKGKPVDCGDGILAFKVDLFEIVTLRILRE